VNLISLIFREQQVDEIKKQYADTKKALDEKKEI
jgi:hypothetical protein